MQKDAARILGTDVLAGAIVSSRGHVAMMATAGVAGVVGGVVAGAVSGARKPPTTPGAHRGLMYLAASPSRLAIFAVKHGLLTDRLDRLLIEHPSDQIQQIDIRRGIVPKIDIGLADGTQYAFECGLANLGKVKKVKAALGK